MFFLFFGTIYVLFLVAFDPLSEFVYCCTLSHIGCVFYHAFIFNFLIYCEFEKIARMFGNSNYIDLSGPTDSVSVSSVVNPECSFVGMSSQLGVCWIPSIICFFLL